MIPCHTETHSCGTKAPPEPSFRTIYGGIPGIKATWLFGVAEDEITYSKPER